MLNEFVSSVVESYSANIDLYSSVTQLRRLGEFEKATTQLEEHIVGIPSVKKSLAWLILAELYEFSGDLIKLRKACERVDSLGNETVRYLDYYVLQIAGETERSYQSLKLAYSALPEACCFNRKHHEIVAITMADEELSRRNYDSSFKIADLVADQATSPATIDRAMTCMIMSATEANSASKATASLRNSEKVDLVSEIYKRRIGHPMLEAYRTSNIILYSTFCIATNSFGEAVDLLSEILESSDARCTFFRPFVREAYIFRAQAYEGLGKVRLAEADIKKARSLSGCESEKSRWRLFSARSVK